MKASAAGSGLAALAHQYGISHRDQAADCRLRSPLDDQRFGVVDVYFLGSERAIELAKFSSPDAKPWDVAANDPANPPTLPSGTTPADAAVWTIIARVLLNLDETVTRE